MNDLTMYMVTHKKVDFVPKGRKIILVGNNNIEGYLKDNVNDNISSKNKYFCELTAIYWIWKNDKMSKYVSIEHYRRFFMNHFFPTVISSDLIKKYLKEYDCIVTRKYYFDKKVKDKYKDGHIAKDLEVVENVIKELYPDYINSYNNVMNGYCTSMCNMIATRKDIFDEYCEWLFNVLFNVEKRIDVENRDAYQQRVFGFLAERLQNVWVDYKGLSVKELPIYHLESSKIKSILKSLKHRKERKCSII